MCRQEVGISVMMIDETIFVTRKCHPPRPDPTMGPNGVGRSAFKRPKWPLPLLTGSSGETFQCLKAKLPMPLTRGLD
jgi:hypothetical protein